MSDITNQATADAVNQLIAELQQTVIDTDEIIKQGRDDVIAIVSAASPIKFYENHAQAIGDIANIPDDGLIEIARDETHSGARTRYFKRATGILEFAVNLDQLRIDLSDPNFGAKLVAFKPDQNSIKIDVSEHLSQFITPLNFGADPSGLKYSDEAFAFFAASIAGKSGFIPAGFYRFKTGKIKLSSNTTIIHGNCVFDISDAPASASMYLAEGSEGVRYSLTENAVKKNYSAKISPSNLVASGVSVGDWVRLCSNEVFDSSRTASKIGEQLQVSEINLSTGEIFFYTAIQDNYSISGGATISRMVHVESPRLEGSWAVVGNNSNKQHKAVTFSICNSPYIDGLAASKLDDRAIYFLDSVFPRADRCNFSDFQSSGTGYGISVSSATQDGRITNITATNVRHLFTTNNTIDRNGIPRRIILDGFVSGATSRAASGSGGDAIDTHAAAEDIHIWNGTVHGSTSQGVNFECASGSIMNVHTYDTRSNGFGIHNETDRAGKLFLSNLHAHRSGGIGVSVLNGGGSGYYESINANALSGEDCAGVGVYIRGTTDRPITQATMSDLSSVRAGSASAGVYLQNINSGYLSGSFVSGGTNASQHAIRLRDIKNFSATQISGSLPDGATGAMVFVNGSALGSVDGVVIDNVTGDGQNSPGARGILVDSTANNVTIGQSCRLDKFTTPISWGSGAGHLGGFLRGSTIYDPPIIAAGGRHETTVSVAGASAGDSARATFSNPNKNIQLYASVTSNSVVTVIFSNTSASDIDLLSGVLKVIVEKI